MTRPRIVILCELYAPEDAATAFFTTGLAEGLASSFEVHVVCAQPTYHRRGVVAPWREVRSGVHVWRAWSTRLDKNRLLPRLLNVFSFTATATLRACRLLRADDILMVGSNPPVLVFSALLLRLLRSCRLLLRIEDLYPDVLVAAGLARPTSPLFRLASLMFRAAYQRADAIVVLGRDMAARLKSLLGKEQKEAPVHVIPNWGEESLFTLPLRRSEAFPGLPDNPALVALFAGNLGRVQDVETIVEAARRLRGRHGIHFLVVGSGAKRAWLLREIQRLELKNVTVMNQMPRSEQWGFLGASDVGLVALTPSMDGISVPSRTYNIMAAGRPVVALLPKHSEIVRMLEETGSGWWVPPGNAEALASLLCWLAQHPEVVQKHGENAREAIRQQYNLGRVVEAYQSIISSLRNVPCAS